MTSQIDVDKIRNTSEVEVLTFEAGGNMVLAKDLKFSSLAAIKDSAGNNILSESGGNVTIANVRLPTSGGISDSSGNAILTESGGVVTVGQNVVGGVPAGAIMSFAMASPPSGWLVCDGSALSRTTYASLFTAIGTTWGAGDGSTTFNLPDLRGAFLRGSGSHGSETMANGNAFAGPSVGSFENDSLQGHKHNTTLDTRSSVGTDPTRLANGAPTTFIGLTGLSSSPVTDSTNGTPRAGDETRPFNAGVKYCIKY